MPRGSNRTYRRPNKGKAKPLAAASQSAPAAAPVTDRPAGGPPLPPPSPAFAATAHSADGGKFESFQFITAMPANVGSSFEELRLAHAMPAAAGASPAPESQTPAADRMLTDEEERAAAAVAAEKKEKADLAAKLAEEERLAETAAQAQREEQLAAAEALLAAGTTAGVRALLPDPEEAAEMTAADERRAGHAIERLIELLHLEADAAKHGEDEDGDGDAEEADVEEWSRLPPSTGADDSDEDCASLVELAQWRLSTLEGSAFLPESLSELLGLDVTVVKRLSQPSDDPQQLMYKSISTVPVGIRKLAAEPADDERNAKGTFTWGPTSVINVGETVSATQVLPKVGGNGIIYLKLAYGRGFCPLCLSSGTLFELQMPVFSAAPKPAVHVPEPVSTTNYVEGAEVLLKAGLGEKEGLKENQLAVVTSAGSGLIQVNRKSDDKSLRWFEAADLQMATPAEQALDEDDSPSLEVRLATVSALCALAKAYSFQHQARAAAKCASLAVGVIEDTPSEGASSPRLVPLLALRVRLRLVCGEVAHAKDDQLRAAAIVGMIEFLYPEVHNDIEALQSCSTGALGAAETVTPDNLEEEQPPHPPPSPPEETEIAMPTLEEEQQLYEDVSTLSETPQHRHHHRANPFAPGPCSTTANPSWRTRTTR